MSTVRTFYNKFCKHFLDKHFLSTKALFAQIAIQALFYHCKERTPLKEKCLSIESMIERKTLTTCKTGYLDPKLMAQTVKLQRTLCNGIISPEITKNVPYIIINSAPTHPAAHRVLGLFFHFKGEVIKSTGPHIEVLRRATGKLIEHKSYFRSAYYRFNYTSSIPFANCYTLIVDVPQRAATQVLHYAGITLLFWEFEESKKLYEFCGNVSEGSLKRANACPGGDALDIPICVCEFCFKFPGRKDELGELVSTIRIFSARPIGMGKILVQDAINMRCLEAVLHASGINCYHDDFDAPEEIDAECYDSYLCLVQGMGQFIRIIEQCFLKIPKGGIQVNDQMIFLPKQCQMSTSTKNQAHHFQHFKLGFFVPAGQIYIALDSPKDELVL